MGEQAISFTPGSQGPSDAPRPGPFCWGGGVLSAPSRPIFHTHVCFPCPRSFFPFFKGLRGRLPTWIADAVLFGSAVRFLRRVLPETAPRSKVLSFLAFFSVWGRDFFAMKCRCFLGPNPMAKIHVLGYVLKKVRPEDILSDIVGEHFRVRTFVWSPVRVV